MIINDIMAKPIFSGASNDIPCCLSERVGEEANSSMQNIVYLSLENAHRMVNRFLNEKGMTKKELASHLDVKVKHLDQLFSEKIPPGLMCRINLPLVKLYCNTQW